MDKEGSLMNWASKTVHELKNAPAHSKIGLGLGITGLGLSIANYKNNRSKMNIDQQRVALDAKSLSALQKIHRALLRKPINPVQGYNVKTNRY
jgi:hypothetical protein